MKGHFSVEWLSQSSSQVSGSHHQQQQQPAPAVSTNTTSISAASVGPPHTPSTSGTVPESLPGFYRQCRPIHSRPSLEVHVENHSDSARRQQSQENRNIQQCVQGQETGFTTSEEEEETSGYESEGGQSLSPGAASKGLHTPPPPPHPPLALSPSSGRRPRTAFTADQINSLEKAFKRNAYLGTQDKAELCKRLSLSDKQIRNWFQNRRMKLKRTVQDALAHACQAKVASHLMQQYPELQSYRPAPYPSYYTATSHQHHHQQEPSATAYISPAGLHYNPSAAVTAAAAAAGHLHGLPTVDALYQYNGLTGLAVASAGPSSRMVPFQPYTHQY
ncbi:ventrally expressed dharma/bozozok antagonist [Engraulis encrasicolus]|uniref:ventrally expressed dharma/bozozok antagonist n=1 Tax=Engraulis encrasicolus TaxID=184585 RepID=UPI002FCF1C38